MGSPLALVSVVSLSGSFLHFPWHLWVEKVGFVGHDHNASQGNPGKRGHKPAQDAATTIPLAVATHTELSIGPCHAGTCLEVHAPHLGIIGGALDRRTILMKPEPGDIQHWGVPEVGHGQVLESEVHTQQVVVDGRHWGKNQRGLLPKGVGVAAQRKDISQDSVSCALEQPSLSRTSDAHSKQARQPVKTWADKLIHPLTHRSTSRFLQITYPSPPALWEKWGSCVC